MLNGDFEMYWSTLPLNEQKDMIKKFVEKLRKEYRKAQYVIQAQNTTQ